MSEILTKQSELRISKSFLTKPSEILTFFQNLAQLFLLHSTKMLPQGMVRLLALVKVKRAVAMMLLLQELKMITQVKHSSTLQVK